MAEPITGDPRVPPDQEYPREARLTVIRVDPATLATRQPNARVITKHRMTFQVEKGLGSEPNTATVTAYNLSPTTRAAFEARPLLLRMDAGFAGNLKRLIEGDVIFARSERQGADWVTRIQVATGARATGHARVQRTFTRGSTVRTAVLAISAALGYSSVAVQTAIAGLNADETTGLDKQFGTGITVSGSARDALSRVLGAVGLRWSIQDSGLQILGSGVRPDQAVVVARRTFMIGTPTFGDPDKQGGQPSLHVQKLLTPEIEPGGKIKVEAANVTGSGFFKVERVTHAGDTKSSEWYTTIEAKPL